MWQRKREIQPSAPSQAAATSQPTCRQENDGCSGSSLGSLVHANYWVAKRALGTAEAGHNAPVQAGAGGWGCGRWAGLAGWLGCRTRRLQDTRRIPGNLYILSRMPGCQDRGIRWPEGSIPQCASSRTRQNKKTATGRNEEMQVAGWRWYGRYGSSLAFPGFFSVHQCSPSSALCPMDLRNWYRGGMLE